MPAAKAKAKPKKRVTAHRRIKKHVKHHYFRIMPNQKSYRVALWVGFFVISAIVAAQMLYPPERAVPFATLNGQAVGGWTHTDIAEKVNLEFSKSTIEVVNTENVAVSAPLGNVGSAPITDSVAMTLEKYPFGQRFIPLSILWQHPQLSDVPLEFTPSVIQDFSQEASKKLTTKPVNASLEISDGKLKATSEKSGSIVSSQQIRQAIESQSGYMLGQKTIIQVVSDQVEPEATAADFAQVRTQAEQALSRQVTLVDDGEVIAPSASERAGWLEVAAKKGAEPSVQLKTDSVDKYLKSLDKKIGKPAGVTRISLVNGIESGRIVGKSGKSIDIASLTKNIEAYLIDGEGDSQLTIPFWTVAPSVIYDGKYTATQTGLRAYVKDAARDQNANISLQQIGGKGWSAQASANASTVSASTYKLFVSLYLFDQIQKGKTSWGSSILDTNTATCFDRMTIASTNPCARDWLARWGRTNVNDFAYSKGFSRGTSFTNPLAVHTTAADLTKLMIGLESGSLVGGADRERLMRNLSIHPYRQGIPAGSAGRVHDKVGFLWDYVHDTAIVYHPRGTYVLTIMTKGRSYGTIAAITREIEKIMYP